MRTCIRCEYSGREIQIDDHHVTYTRVITKVYLCRPCHIGITVLNSIFVYKYHKGKMDNYQRRRIFNLFMKNSWRMNQEDKPIVRLQRRVRMGDLPKLQEMFFKNMRKVKK
jgi:hypothetical protein